LDGELRADLGAPDVRLLAAFRAPDAEAALQGAERVAALLAPLVAAGLVGEIDHPARWLPSAATQRARQAALPEDALLRARMAEAMAGLQFRATAFDRFLADVAASRHLAPLLPESLGAAPVLRARLEPLLAPRGAGWQALILPSDVRDMAALRAALRAIEEPGLLAVEVKPETEALVATATSRSLVWCGVGGVLVLGLLAAGLGGIGPALRTVLPLGAALGLTVALLALLGEKLMLFHLVALLLLAGVGMDYALFLGRAGTEAPEERLRALRSVFNCTLTTLLTFGLLALCSTPLLRSIGLTVAIGVVAAFLLAAALAPRATPR
jgi:predicted exporter